MRKVVLAAAAALVLSAVIRRGPLELEAETGDMGCRIDEIRAPHI